MSEVRDTDRRMQSRPDEIVKELISVKEELARFQKSAIVVGSTCPTAPRDQYPLEKVR